MIVTADDRFRLEARAYRLVFTCEDCAWFDSDTGRCSHGYPNDAHRARDLDRMAEVVFCKEFELA